MTAKYIDIYNDICQKIASGFFKVGDMLPAEMEMVREYGVSRITVQKALKMLVKDDVIERIAGKGTFLRCLPGEQKAALTLALILPENDPEMMALLCGAQKQADICGYNTKIYFTNKMSENEPDVVNAAIKDGVAGVIIYPNSGLNNSQYFRKIQKHTSLVFVDKPIEGVVTNTVMANNFEGAYEMVNYLVNTNGHKRIAFFSYKFSLQSISVIDRKNGYKRALIDNGIPIDEKLIVDISSRSALDEVFANFFSDPSKSDVTAIFFSTDETAMDCILHIYKNGKSIPEDISICGFDDSYLGRTVRPELTTVSQNFSIIGENAIKQIAEKIETGNQNQNIVYIPTHVVKRNSVKNLLNNKG